MRRTIIPAAALALAVATILAPTAAADEPSTTVVAYTATFGGIVCDVLDDYPTPAGVIGIAQAIQDDGLSAYEAGQVIGLSVAEICPRHLRLMQRFIDIYGGSQVA